MFKKNISDGVGSRNGSIDAPLNPPLFWLDNIFKDEKDHKKRNSAFKIESRNLIMERFDAEAQAWPEAG